MDAITLIQLIKLTKLINVRRLYLLFGRGRRKPPETSMQVLDVDFRRIYTQQTKESEVNCES